MPTIYAYSSNSIYCTYSISSARSGSNCNITVSGTIYGNGSSANTNGSLYLHLRYNISPGNGSGTTTYVSSYGSAYAGAQLIRGAPLNSSTVPKSGLGFSKKFTVSSNSAATYNDLGIFLSGSSSSPSSFGDGIESYMFIGKKSSSLSESKLRYSTQSVSFASNTCTITTVANGHGSVSGGGTKTIGSSVKLSATPNTSNAHYTYYFSKWSGGSSSTSATISFTATGSATYTANFGYSVNSYTVYFNGNGGSASSSSYVRDYGSAIGTLPTASKTGYVFQGWYTATSGGSKISTSTTVTANVTYYAQWTAAIYTQTAYSNGGVYSGNATSSAISVTYARALPTITRPSRTGYTLQGFRAGSTSGGILYNASGTPQVLSGYTDSSLNLINAASYEIYATWLANTYTASFCPYVYIVPDSVLLSNVTLADLTLASISQYTYNKNGITDLSATTETFDANSITPIISSSVGTLKFAGFVGGTWSGTTVTAINGSSVLTSVWEYTSAKSFIPILQGNARNWNRHVSGTDVQVSGSISYKLNNGKWEVTE